jgi:1,4-alpha-glucan branching enzyme
MVQTKPPLAAKPAAAPAPKPKPAEVSSLPAAALIPATTQAALAAAPAGPDAKAKPLPVVFRLKAPQARSVLLALDSLAGKRKAMVRSVDGTWSFSLPLAPGSYRYQFIVDGKRTLDPENTAVERGASLLKVP